MAFQQIGQALAIDQFHRNIGQTLGINLADLISANDLRVI